MDVAVHVAVDVAYELVIAVVLERALLGMVAQYVQGELVLYSNVGVIAFGLAVPVAVSVSRTEYAIETLAFVASTVCEAIGMFWNSGAAFTTYVTTTEAREAVAPPVEVKNT